MSQKVVVVPGREPEGRVDPITGSEVIISAARSMREGKNKPLYAHEIADLPEKKNACFFCPGNEDSTPPELFSFRSNPFDPSSWTTRAFSNLFPILALEAKGEHTPENPALGVNEVVVETRRHNGFLSSLSIEEIAEAFRAIISRYFSLRGDPRLEWFSVFKNYGALAGASVEHSHFQIAVKARIPKKFRERFNRAQEYFWNKGSYLCCDQIKRHKEINQVVWENDSFVVFVPFEARLPYHLRIYPKIHNPSFAHVLRDSDKIRRDFAQILKETVYLFKIAVQGEEEVKYSDPTYNFYIETAPYRDDHKEGIFHWHVEFLGKTTTEAGYEKHTGEFVNTTYPEEIASQLKEIASKNDYQKTKGQ